MDNILLLLFSSAVGAVFSWVGVRLIRNYAYSQQSQGLNSTAPASAPRGGGIAILCAALLIFMPLGFSLGDPAQVVRFSVSAVLIGLIGFLDDLRKMPRIVRIGLQTVAALVFVPAALIPEIGLPFLNLTLQPVVGYVVSVVWLVVMSNAYTFMDGTDGLAGSQAIVAAGIWAGIGLLLNDPLIITFGALIAGVSAGFLVYNLPPASILMGEVGSSFIGFSLAAMPMLAVSRDGSSRLMVSGALILGLFLFDASVTFVRYAIHGQLQHRHTSRSHLYQRLLALGDSPLRVVVLYLLITILFGAAGIIYWLDSTWVAVVICGLASLSLFAWIKLREQESAHAPNASANSTPTYPANPTQDAQSHKGQR